MLVITDDFFWQSSVQRGELATSTCVCQGRREVHQARERIAQALAFARDSNNPYDLAFGRMLESWLSCLLREPQRAEVAATQALVIAEKHGFLFVGSFTSATLGWARAQLGRAGEGVGLIRQGLGGLAEIGIRAFITHDLTRLAQAQALDGRIDDALVTIRRGAAGEPGTRRSWWSASADIHR